MLKVGQEVEARVVDINEEDQKISLSIRSLLNNQEKESVDEE